jgi:hypothetical protein
LENRPAKAAKVITESVTEVTGDKPRAQDEPLAEDRSNVIDLKRLAGL